MSTQRVPWLQGSTILRDHPWVVLLSKSLEDDPPPLFDNFYGHDDFPVGITLEQAMALVWRAKAWSMQGHGKLKLHYEFDIPMHVLPEPSGYTGPHYSDFTAHHTYDITCEFTWPEGDLDENHEVIDGIPQPGGGSVFLADAGQLQIDYEIHWTGTNHVGGTDTFDSTGTSTTTLGGCSVRSDSNLLSDLLLGLTSYFQYWLCDEDAVPKTFWPLFDASIFAAGRLTTIPTPAITDGGTRRVMPSDTLTGTENNGTIVNPDIAGTMTVSPVVADNFDVWINISPTFRLDVYVIQNPVHYYADDGVHPIYGWAGGTVAMDYEFTVITPFTTTVVAQEFWPFLNRAGEEVYDTSDGHQIHDPFG